MLFRSSRLKLKYQSDEQFFRFYRFLYKFVGFCNEFMRILLPLCFVLWGMVIVATIFYILRGRLTPFDRLGLMILFFFVLIALLLMAVVGGEVANMCAELKKIRTDGEELPCKFTRACYDACPPIKVWVGVFSVLSRHTPFKLLYRIIDTLVSLLCATRPM